MAWYTHPLAIKGGISVASGIYNALKPDQLRNLSLEVIEDMKEQRKKLQRMSRGTFTGQEREEIAAGAEPGLNRLAGNLAQRGLGQSGAGAQVMAQASVQPYTDARAAAEQQLTQVNQNIFDAAGMLPADDSFFDDLGAFAGLYEEYNELQNLTNMEDDDGILNGAVNWLAGLMQKARDYQASQVSGVGSTPSADAAGGYR